MRDWLIKLSLYYDRNIMCVDYYVRSAHKKDARLYIVESEYLKPTKLDMDIIKDYQKYNSDELCLAWNCTTNLRIGMAGGCTFSIKKPSKEIVDIIMRSITEQKVTKWAQRALGAIDPYMKEFNRLMLNWYEENKQ